VRVLVAGASGFIGTALVERLIADGHEIVRLVRRRAQSPDEASWSPGAGIIDFTVMDRVDAVVNLSGASLARLPWSRSYQGEILDSRIAATRTITDAMRKARRPPAVLLNASAVGIYGDRPGELLT
jgi:NAD dependent epimerase/dehydratase family enzyme